jgi:NAD(P)H-flavin reductase
MAVVKKYPAKVCAIHNLIDGVYTLELESLDNPFKYEPGQFLHLTLDEYDPSKQWPESRCFSMQSNPGEAIIKITYSVKGQYTRKMEQYITVGTKVWLKLPYGNLFSQPHSKENTVFIAGGTGITPFLSLFTHESFNEYIKPHIYIGFRSKGYNIYNNELSFKKLCELEIYYEDSDGLLDINQIFSRNGPNRNYFISGPPKMIKAFKQSLIANKVPAYNIISDDWA